jgi:8-oxo-dGTP diphosphatase
MSHTSLMKITGCGGIDINDDGLLLMLREGTGTFDRQWSNPGGGVEQGEDPRAAVIREHREELGVTVRIIRHISNYEDRRDSILKGVYAGYLVETVEGVANIQEPDKVAELRRFPLEKLPEPLAPYTRQYLRDLGLI